MARDKEIIIAGMNLLESLADAWGGVNNTGADITPYSESGATTVVPDGYKWGMNFAEVERFIKSQYGGKVGCIKRVVIPAGGEDKDYLVAFPTATDYNAWSANHSDPDHQPLEMFELPAGGGGSVSAYSMTLDGNAPAAIQRSNDFTVRLYAASTYNGSNIPEQVTLTIQTRTGTSSWVTRGTRKINSNTWTNVSMQGILPTGDLDVRISAAGEYASTPFPYTFSVNIVNLTLAPATTFERPFAAGGSTLMLSYNLTGSIDKTLELEFDGSITRNADPGTASYPDAPFTFELSGAEELLTPGTHTLRAMLYAKADDTVATDWVESEYLVSGVLSPSVAVNNVTPSVSNWSDVHFLDWMLVLPEGMDTLNVLFRLTARNSDETLKSWPFNNTGPGLNQFITQLAVDDLANGRVNMALHIEDDQGNELHAPVNLVVVNDSTFAPVAGASFVMSPAVRSNTESNPATVVNTVNNEVVATSEDFVNFDFSTDGWIETSYQGATVKVLRVPAGRRLTIHHNPFANFTGGNNAGYSATFMLDFAVNAVTDEEDVLLSIGRENNGEWRGLVLWALRAALLTSKQQVEADQDVSWAENRRFHLAVVVQHNAYAADPQQSIPAANLVRIYLNGVLEREMAYDTDEALTPSGASIVIGGNSADIDIYGKRSYNKALSSVDVIKDYKASMSTVSEKIAFAAANDILDQENRIDWDRCMGKYNVIGHKGRLLNYDTVNDEAMIESLEIHIVGDDENSGILTNLDNKGQGTTAMGYYWWNQQYKIRTGNDHPTQFLDFQGNPKVGDFKGFAIAPGEPLATKLVGKVNFASSMQSHKLGLTKAYTDVYKQMLRDGTLQTVPSQLGRRENGELIFNDPCPRLAVLEKPFLFFVWDEEHARWKFQNLMTFGPGKGDKPTFGFDKNATPHMLMVEGANNEEPLPFFNIPWDEKVVYNPEKETWDYPNIDKKNINFGFGKTSNDEPSDAEAIASMKRFFNFVYMHSQNIEPYDGTLRQLRQDTSMGGSALVPQVWLTSNHRLYRYCTKEGDWIDAGIDGAEVDLAAEYLSYTGTELDTSLGAEDKNELFKAARLAHFKAYANDIFVVEDILYHKCTIKFWAGTDNWVKNTYYYTEQTTTMITDPFTGQEVAHHRVRMMEDDVDTVIKTNNVGQNRKPYWVEEHTKNNGVNYWAGEGSVFNNLLEAAWDKDNSSEPYNLQRTMRNMLSAMARISGSVLNFIESYLLRVQRTDFPAMAYNEQARVVYETAYRQWSSTAEGTYSHGTNPLSQSCGSQLWSEYQWLVDRIMFISSWCQYGEFASTEGAPGGVNWRSRPGVGGTSLRLTPAKWLYPRVAQGGVNAPPTALTEPGSVYVAPTMSPQSDTTLYIRGINYLSKLGDMDVYQHLTDQPTFPFTGSRLQEVTVNPNGTNDPVKWTSQRVIVTATNIKRYIHRKTPSARGELDLSACVRLEEINVEGTSFTEVKLPPTGSLTSLRLPETLEHLTLENMRNLATLKFGAGDNIVVDALQTVAIRNTPAAPSLEIVQAAIDHLTSVNVTDIDWRVSGPSGLALLNKLAAMGSNCKLSGTITLTTSAPSFEEKAAWLQAWGDVDHGTNGLTIVYPQSTIEDVRIITGKYLERTGDHQLRLNSEGNTFTAVSWEISQNGYATIDPVTGIVTVWQLAPETDGAYADVTVRITPLEGPELTDTKRFYFCEHVCREGDYVYADGSFSDELVSYKTVVAMCFYINPNNPADRLAVSRGNVITDQWGLYNDASYGVQNVTVDGYTSIYDTPVINIQSNGNGDIDNLSSMASFATYLRTTAVGDVGFVELTEDIGPFRIGDFIHVGQYKTLQIIRHRNRILNGVTSDVGSHVPKVPTANANQTEREVLTNLIADIVAKKGNNYRQFYYPAASYCYAYQPTYALQPGEVLADKFKAHNWWLATCGELGMVYWQQVKGGIFAAAAANGKYSNLTNDWHWTSTEYNASNAWYLHGGNGQVVGNYGTGTKNGSRAVRAVVAF